MENVPSVVWQIQPIETKHLKNEPVKCEMNNNKREERGEKRGNVDAVFCYKSSKKRSFFLFLKFPTHAKLPDDLTVLVDYQHKQIPNGLFWRRVGGGREII